MIKFTFDQAWQQPHLVTQTISQKSYEYDVAALANVATAKQWRTVWNQLQLFRQYLADWDGMGSSQADAISVGCAAAFLSWARAATEPPPQFATLGPDGFIRFEWQNGKVFKQAEFGAGNIDWAYYTSDSTSDIKPQRWSEKVSIHQKPRGATWDSNTVTVEDGAASASAL